MATFRASYASIGAYRRFAALRRSPDDAYRIATGLTTDDVAGLVIENALLVARVRRLAEREQFYLREMKSLHDQVAHLAQFKPRTEAT
jgi:hypothetical protein